MTRSSQGQTRTNTGVRGAGSAVPPFRRQTVVTMTLEALRERILRGDYPEGAPLRQDAIAVEFGVSRIPVREALRQLEAEGLVTISPHQGATVSTLSIDEVRELFELRALIESDLLRRAIPQLTESDLKRAAEILTKYEAFPSGDDECVGGAELGVPLDAAHAGGAAAHDGVGESANQSDRYIRLQLSLTGGQSRASDEHHAILDAVRHQVDRACALLAAHITGAGRSLVNFLREHRGLTGERPSSGPGDDRRVSAGRHA